MADWTQFEKFENKPAACAVCEAMLPDAVDGSLPASEQRVFDQHVAGCVVCARELEEAQRGAAWLAMLKSQAPEAPAGLLTKILAETTGVASATSAAGNLATPTVGVAGLTTPRVPAAPAWAMSSLWKRTVNAFRIDMRRTTFQPRLAMTAAMAFFSLALTLNLTGVRLHELRASSFTPSGMRRTVADMSASATRSFQNLRVVYQVESRVSELRHDDSPVGDREPAVLNNPLQNDGASPRGNEAKPTENDGNTDDSQPKQDKPKPRGSSDLVMPLPERFVRGAQVARKEV